MPASPSSSSSSASPDPATPDPVDVLRASVLRLHDVVTPLSPEQLRQPSYADEWTIAQVLSHIGSGAVIMRERLDDALVGRESSDAFMHATWDTWNAKSPDDQAAEALVADRALLDRLASLTPADRTGVRYPLGPMTLDFRDFVQLRLNEHGLHTWDVAVALDPSARLPEDVTEVVVDNLEMIARFTGRPAGSEESASAAARTVRVRTSDPWREIVVDIGTDAVALSPVDLDAPAPSPDLEIPAEAFIRLVFGRLDPATTPPGLPDAVLDDLRSTFPGP